MIGVIIGLFIVAVIIIAFCIKQTIQHNKDYTQIKNDLPIIQQNSQIIEAKLSELHIDRKNHYSSLGYKFIQYRTEFNAPDNLNLIVDYSNKLFVEYLFLPYTFNTHNFEDLFDYALFVNDGKVETEKTGLATGSAVGGIGFGVSTSTSTSQTEVTAICVSLYFKDGTSCGINFIDNVKCYKGDTRYNTAIAQANEFCRQMELIKKQNKQE